MRGNIRMAFFAGLISAILLFQSTPDFIASLKPAIDPTQVSASEIKPGAHVKTEVFMLIDNFASEETYTKNSNGSRTPSKISAKYYIFPVGEEEYMALRGGSKNYANLDAIVKATHEFVSSGTGDFGQKTVEIEGVVKKMDSELLQYYTEWFTDNEFFNQGENPDDYVLNYCVEPRDFTAVRILFGVGAGIFLLDALYLFRQYKKGKATQKAEESVDLMA